MKLRGGNTALKEPRSESFGASGVQQVWGHRVACLPRESGRREASALSDGIAKKRANRSDRTLAHSII